jgi:dihydrofolate reductase
MKIALIVAMASNHVIGMNNKIPWHLSADLKKFKQITLGSPILMGRKTHESIGKTLLGRKNIIISRNPLYQSANCQVFTGIQAAMASCLADQQLFVIGGAHLYQLMFAKADFIYLTEIHKHFTGDTYFPKIDPHQWQEVARQDINNDPQVDFNYSFVKFQRLIDTLS